MAARRAPTGGKQPDYNLSAKDKRTGRQMRVGAAWVHPDGRISIQLDPFVALSGAEAEDMLLSLFPNDSKQRVIPIRPPEPVFEDFGDEDRPEAQTAADDIPF